MTDPSPSRKAHVTRIIAVDVDGTKYPNMTLDILRIDEYKTKVSGAAAEWATPGLQFKKHTISWQDDTNNAETGNPSRKTTTLKICGPHEPDPRNPTRWWPIEVTNKYNTLVTDMTGTGVGDDQKKKNQFQIPDDQTSELPDGFKYTAVRVTHMDTNLDDDPTYDNGGVIPYDDYFRDTTTENKADYLDTAIIQAIPTKVSHQTGTGMGDDQKKIRRFYNDYLIEMFPEPIDPPLNSPPFNPPWILDPYQYIINVHLETIYLVISIGASNDSFSTFSPAPLVSAPSFSAKGDQNQGVKLLDSQPTPNSANVFANIPNTCFVYGSGYGSVEEAWTAARGPWSGPGPRPGGFGGFNPVGGACPWPGGGEPPDLTTVSPLEFASTNEPAGMNYLYEIPAGDGLVVVNVSGLIPNHDSEDTASASSVSTGGAATVIASVYSTIRDPVKKLSDIVDYLNDGKPRPDPDDGSKLAVTNKNQGKFLINVKLDTNIADVQTDNYGNKFQPYKVTFTPSKDAVDLKTPQPPPLLPKK